MKVIFATIFAFAFVQTASAQSLFTSDCLKEFATIQKWTAFTPSQAECLSDSSEFMESMALLCSADQSKLSPKYLRFLQLQKKYQDAWAVYQAASPTERNLKLIELQDAKRDLETFGNDGVYQNLNSVAQVKFHCTQQ